MNALVRNSKAPYLTTENKVSDSKTDQTLGSAAHPLLN